jgi:S1-C subfamily serine protease
MAPADTAPVHASASRRSALRPLTAVALAALVGGGVALGGAWAIGAFDEETQPVLETQVASALPAVSATGLGVQEIYRRSAPAVVQVTTTHGGGRSGADGAQALGSGFVIDKSGHIVTNYHVVEGADSIEVSFSNKDTLEATVVGSDPSTDLAVLDVDAGARALAPLALADSDAVRVGDPVVAIGNPFGLERTVTAGIVSALQREVSAPNGYTIDHVIQTDAPINQGNSGGPLIDANGEVVGVNSQILTGGGGGNVGIGFAVPSDTVKAVVAQILAHGSVERAFLGVSARPIDADLARAFRLPVDSGLLVETVAGGSGAQRAGLRAGDSPVVLAGESYSLGGDVIVAADGTPVTSVEDLRDVLATHQPGDRIELEIYRGGSKRTVTATLGRQPATTTR